MAGHVSIETRGRPTDSTYDSPDEMHCVTVWTYEDSHGQRSVARLNTTWQNPRSDRVNLVKEGPWRIEVKWLASDHLDLKVVPVAGVTVPPIRSSWRDISITVNTNKK